MTPKESYHDDETGALRRQVCVSGSEHHFRGNPGKEFPIIIKTPLVTFYFAGEDQSTLRQTMSVYPDGKVVIYEGPKGMERIVKIKRDGYIEHYVGGSGSECLVKVECPDGEILHFDGAESKSPGNERLWKREHPDGIVSLWAGKQGKERKTKVFYQDGYVEVYQGQAGVERLSESISPEGNRWFYIGQKGEERCTKVMKGDRTEYCTGERFQERVCKSAHLDGSVRHYEGVRGEEHLVREELPSGIIFHWRGLQSEEYIYGFQRPNHSAVHHISVLMDDDQMDAEIRAEFLARKEQKRSNLALKHTQTNPLSFNERKWKTIVVILIKKEKEHAKQTAKNMAETARRKKIRDAANEAAASRVEPPFTTPGPSHPPKPEGPVADPLDMSNETCEKAKKKAQREKSKEDGHEHAHRLRKAREERLLEDERKKEVLEVARKIQLGID